MTWEIKLREKLIQLKGNRPMRSLAEDTGLSANTLYKIIKGERGIGAATLETLRATRPDLLVDLFLPADYPIVHEATVPVDNPILDPA